MKTKTPPHRRAFVALVPLCLIGAPALAQEVPSSGAAPPAQSVTPPPIMQVTPQPTPAPIIIAPPIIVTPTPTDTVTTPPVAAEPTSAAERAPVDRTAPAQIARKVPARRAAPANAAPVKRAAPVAAPVEAAPVAEAPITPLPADVPVDVTALPVPPVATAPAPTVDTQVADTATTESAPIWPWLLGGLLVAIAAIGAFLWSRRRSDEEEEYYEEQTCEPDFAEPAPVAVETPAPVAEPLFLRPAPVAAAPVAAAAPAYDPDLPVPTPSEDATQEAADADDVAAITAVTPPVADRPWLEFALRPIRAGSNVDEALVEFELTVGNSGSIPAKDVRISTFMFASEPASQDEMERMLIERGESESIAPMTIKPGEGTRIDATLALLKAEMLNGNGAFVPVVVADARYPLPGGGEGRTSASFTIGVSEEDGPEMAPIALDRPRMHDEVDSRLHGVPEHA